MPPGRFQPVTRAPMLLAELQRCLDAGMHESAVAAADALLAVQRRSVPARLGRARANLSLGRVMDADQDVAEALRLMPQDPQAGLIRAQVDHRLGRIDAAVDRLRALTRAGGPLGVEATVVLSEVLQFAHRHADLSALVAAGGTWSRDPRSTLAAARVMARERPADAIEALRPLACAAHGPVMHRVAGFEIVQLLDRTGRFREAFELAAALHAATTPPYDLEGLLLGVRDQREMVERGGPAFRPRCDPVEGVAIMVALPRSGTTLLEQMLDRHPAIAGIGEYEGIERVGAALVSTGLWPRGHARRCLDLLGLPMDPAVLAPEGNARAVYTLSHEQVRRPINAASIGRWRNYAWAFDGSWDAPGGVSPAAHRGRDVPGSGSTSGLSAGQ